jgi:hypothetical protein
MKRATKVISGALSMALLLACDGGKELLGKGAEAEAQGSFPEAAAQYRAVCEQRSALCPIATRQAERLKLKEAGRALDQGRYKQAKEALDTALASSDAGVKRGAEALGKSPELEQGLLWEEASTSPNQDEALARIEAVSKVGVVVSKQAKEWLGQHRPRILLGRVKAACKPEGSGSCVEAGQAIARLHPASPEDKEAQQLVAADYARVYPRLVKAESLLAQWAQVCDRVETCFARKEEERTYGPTLYQDCIDEVHGAGRKKESEGDAANKEEGAAEATPTVDFLKKEWGARLEEIHDPFFVKALEARKALTEKDCVHDPEPRPTPAKPR